MSDRLVCIAAFWEAHEGNFARNLLQENGIKAELTGEAVVGNLWYVANAVGGIKLYVLEADVEKALHILERDEPADDLPPEPDDLPPEADEPIEEFDRPEANPEPDQPLNEREKRIERAFRIGLFSTLFIFCWVMPLIQVWFLWKMWQIDAMTEPVRPSIQRIYTYANILWWMNLVIGATYFMLFIRFGFGLDFFLI